MINDTIPATHENTVRLTTFSIAQWMNFTSQMLLEREYDHQIHLVEEALGRNAIVILMRGRNYWEREIPRLKEHPYYTLNSAQSASISEKTLSVEFAIGLMRGPMGLYK